MEGDRVILCTHSESCECCSAELVSSICICQHDYSSMFVSSDSLVRSGCVSPSSGCGAHAKLYMCYHRAYGFKRRLAYIIFQLTTVSTQLHFMQYSIVLLIVCTHVGSIRGIRVYIGLKVWPSRPNIF